VRGVGGIWRRWVVYYFWGVFCGVGLGVGRGVVGGGKRWFLFVSYLWFGGAVVVFRGGCGLDLLLFFYPSACGRWFVCCVGVVGFYLLFLWWEFNF